MTTENILGYSIADTAGIRGVASAATVRLTRQADAASALVHAIDPTLMRQIKSEALETQAPDFRRPFVTRITGVVEHGGTAFLIEPLVPAVPLLDVWLQVLHHAPGHATAVLRAVTWQLAEALAELQAAGRSHGALGVENVVLSAAGVYGLLVARLPIAHDWLWLRPLRRHSRDVEERNDRAWNPDSEESPAGIVVELAEIAVRENVLSRAQQAELEALREQQIDCAFNDDNDSPVTD